MQSLEEKVQLLGPGIIKMLNLLLIKGFLMIEIGIFKKRIAEIIMHTSKKENPLGLTTVSPKNRHQK